MFLPDLRNRIFYTFKPILPRPLQLFLRRTMAVRKKHRYAHVWPIDPQAGKPPPGWPGWPHGKQFAFVLSHDVDTRKGYERVLKLAALEERLGFRSQFNFVPERYGEISLELLGELRRRGFEIGVHGLRHDGKLFRSKKTFDERAPRINAYLKQWGTRAFTTPSMIRNHSWMHALAIDFCISTFDTDPFEPQSDGVGTIFPYWVQNEIIGNAFLELPYTLVQDFTLFVLLREKSIVTWTRKVEWVAAKGGMALLNSHPDYMRFDEGRCRAEEYPAALYESFLQWVKLRFASILWHALPVGVHEYLVSRRPVKSAPLESGEASDALAASVCYTPD